MNNRQPAYQAEVVRLAHEAMARGEIKPGTLSVVLVAHDHWCDQLAGRGPCNCDPEIRITPSKP
jgi:hypothetical protein